MDWEPRSAHPTSVGKGVSPSDGGAASLMTLENPVNRKPEEGVRMVLEGDFIDHK